jgi:hypothetical protein
MTETPFVYSVREPRCGGTHLIESIKTLYYNLHQGKKKLDYIDTHVMDYIRGLNKEIKPDQNIHIIRCDRRNLIEHFFSMIFIEITNGFTNVRFYETMADHPSLIEGLEKKIVINEEKVKDYVSHRLRTHLNFLRHTENLNSTTIYYEDWDKKFDLPSLGLYDIDLCNGMQYTKKLPDYKRAVFVNYDEAASWIEKHKNDYIKIHNAEKFFEHWTSHSSS